MSEIPQGQRRWNGELDFAAALCLVTSLVFIGFVVFRCGFGLDLTDEGFYLTWISRPEIYRSSATQFGFVFKPLYHALGYDLVLLRQVNVVVTLGLSYVAFWMLLAPAAFVARHRAVFALALSSSALLMLHHMWLPTPSYNWLNLQGLLIALIGLLLSLRSDARKSHLSGGALIGLGGVVVALAKPTSAIALAVLLSGVFAWELWRRPHSALPTAASAAAAAMLGGLVAAWLIDGSILVFADRLRKGAELGYTLGSNLGHKHISEYAIVRWDRFQAPRHFGRHFAILATLSAVYTVFCRSSTARACWTRSLILTVLSLAALSALLWPDTMDLLPNKHYAYLIPAVLTGALLAATAVARTRKEFATAGGAFAVLFFLPIVHAIGTTNNIWLQASQALLFWIAAAIVAVGALLDGEHRRRVVAGLSLTVAAMCAILVENSMEQPYRQTAALRTQTVPVAADTRSSRTIYVTSETADFIAGLRSAAGEGGMRRLLDVTGRHPAAAYLAGAAAPGTPWLLGGYRNSTGFFHAVLNDVPCDEIADAWLLVAPAEARQSLPISVLTSYGMDLERDFRRVGDLSSPWYKTRLGLWRPIRPLDEAARACTSARGFDVR